MTTVTDGLYQFGGMPVGPALMGVGNVYYVCQTANTVVHADMVQRFGGQKYKNDHSNILHNTVTSALLAVVSKRNDYIIVNPDSSDYAEVATLTMDDNNVHLICPAGLGCSVGCATRAVTIAPAAAAAAITMSGRGCEVGGFWLRGYTEQRVIYNTGVGAWIHNNDVAIGSTTTDAGGIESANQMATIEGNHVFTNIGAGTAVYGIYASGDITRTIIKGNIITVALAAAMTYGIRTNQYGGMCIVDSNILYEQPALAGGGASTLTNGIHSGEGTLLVNNRIGMTDISEAYTGYGTTDESWVENYTSSGGGLIALG